MDKDFQVLPDPPLVSARLDRVRLVVRIRTPQVVAIVALRAHSGLILQQERRVVRLVQTDKLAIQTGVVKRVILDIIKRLREYVRNVVLVRILQTALRVTLAPLEHIRQTVPVLVLPVEQELTHLL